MCSTLGLLQNWWTVAGLLLDIVGFSVLAIDLGREYSRHKAIQELEKGADAADFLFSEKPIPETERAPFDYTSDVMRLRQRLIALWHRADLGMAQSRAEKLGLNTFSLPDGYDESAQALRTLARQTASARLKRSPIFVGISLVIGGFILQLIGAIPC